MPLTHPIDLDRSADLTHVQGVPSWWYTHVGTKVLIDGRGRGSLIMDPSFVEKRFFVRSKRYVLSHLTEAYQAGLRGNLLQVIDPLPQIDPVLDLAVEECIVQVHVCCRLFLFFL